MSKHISKVLTFRASSIGDCLMGKYLLENIHVQYPSARLVIVVGSRGAMISDLFKADTWLEVIEANRRNPRTLFDLIKNFYGSDLVITQYAGKRGGAFSFASKLFARLLAKKGGLIGFADASGWNTALYDKIVPLRQESAVVEHDREALRAAGIPISLPFPTLEFVHDDSVLMKFHLETGKFFIVHFFAGGKGRSLSPEKSRELLLALRKELDSDIQIVVSGGKGDRESALQIANGIDARVIADEASLQEMMNLIKSSKAVVSVDTGMAHITAQLGKPLLVMSTCLGHNWWFTGQYDDKAPITVFSRDDICVNGHMYKNYPDCINAIGMNEVAARVTAVDDIIGL